MGGSTLDRRAGYRVTLDLPVTLDAPGTARRALDGIDHGFGREREYTLKLLISELVSNSVKHCGIGSVKVEIETWGNSVRVDVIDVGPSFVPGPRMAEPDVEGGWGLVLVDQLATRWGSIRPSAHVWFEIDAAA